MRYIKPLLTILSAVSLITSCIMDHQEECSLDLRFRYVYNMQNADGFTNEASHVRVYVFDSARKYVGCHVSQGPIGKDYVMRLPLPEAGTYTFVAWAFSDSDQSDFEIPVLNAGDDVNALTARLNRTDGVSDRRLCGLLNGTLETEVSVRNRHLTIDMMKCTNLLRVILMPIRSTQVLDCDDYELRISGKNGWLSYDASMHRQDPLVYRPYFQAQDSKKDSGQEDVINTAVVADFSTSRIINGSNPRLIIDNKRTGREILNIDLAWFLSLQSIGEHKEEWTSQEYLDRQDEYSMTFFIDDSTWLMTRIIVNGWVLSFENTDLG